jgi:hypothetical protein
MKTIHTNPLTRISMGKVEKCLEIDGGDGCTM